MAPKNEFKHESIQDTESIVSYLQALCEGFQNKRLVLSSDEEQIVLEPQGLLKLAVRVKRKSGQNKFSFSLDWTESPEEEKVAPLRIETAES